MPDDNLKARCPIDFDHNSPEHAKTWPAEFQKMRETCPRAWTDNHDGFWIASKYKDIISIAQRPDTFSAHKDLNPVTGEAKGGVAIPVLPGVRGAPNETESPEWNSLRNFLNRRFAPKAVEERRKKAKYFAAALIDMVIEKGEFDIVDDFTNPLPALVTMDLFGFPLHEWRKFADPFHKMVYTQKTDPKFMETLRGLDYFQQRVDEEIAIRRKNPSDDMLGYLASGTIDGEPLDRQRIQDLAFNILAGGVDTTTALASHTFLHLSRHPEHRQRLIDEPGLLPLAREEFLRHFSPIHAVARNVKHDIDVDGWKFMKGERVLLAYASANHDDEIFPQPEEVKLDRLPNRHIAFGAGAHRCIGSFLARLMFDVMIEEVLQRLPDYKVMEEKIVPYPTILINGWINIPATFTPGRKVGATLPT